MEITFDLIYKRWTSRKCLIVESAIQSLYHPAGTYSKTKDKGDFGSAQSKSVSNHVVNHRRIEEHRLKVLQEPSSNGMLAVRQALGGGCSNELLGFNFAWRDYSSNGRDTHFNRALFC